MDVESFQDMFRVLDQVDGSSLRNDYLHPDMVVNVLGVEGLDAPLTRDQFISFLHESKNYRDERGESFAHIPSLVKVQGNMAFVDGLLLLTYPEAVDEYQKYTDFFKLQDDRIIEYNLVSYQLSA